MTVLFFIIALGILVLVHEWGHFIIARKSGIRVEQFSIGFGPKILGFKRGETEYRISLLPLGGYVKLFGENPEAEAEGDEAKARAIAAAPDAFSNAPFKNRLATVLGGPFTNLLLALILLPVIYMIGRMAPVIMDQPPVIIEVMKDSPAAAAGLQTGDHIKAINGDEVDSWSDVSQWVVLHANEKADLSVERDGQAKSFSMTVGYLPDSNQEAGYAGFEPLSFIPPKIGFVGPGTPAEKAGLAAEDLIVKINGQPLKYWYEFQEKIRAEGGSPVELVYERAGEAKAITITPMQDPEDKSYRIGIAPHMPMVLKKYSVTEAVKKGFDEFKSLVVLTGDILGRLFSGKLSYKSLGGPLAIAQMSGAAAEAGISAFLHFMAFLSIQLGILNLLPIPVLDGGHVLFMTIETIRRKPLSLKFKNALTLSGMAALLVLMVLITINDIDRLWNFSKIWEKITGLF